MHVCPREFAIKIFNRWFSRYVIAVMWWTVNKRLLISSLRLSTSICSFHHSYLCLPRWHENHPWFMQFNSLGTHFCEDNIRLKFLLFLRDTEVVQSVDFQELKQYKVQLKVLALRNHSTSSVACVASVSVRFRSKERGTRVKDRAKMAWVKERGGSGQERKETFLPLPLPPLSFFGSCFISRAAKTENPVPWSFFAPKPNGNACYAGYLIGQTRLARSIRNTVIGCGFYCMIHNQHRVPRILKARERVRVWPCFGLVAMTKINTNCYRS